MRTFLDTGVLISDSCWETYRLSNWKRDSSDRVTWEEDRQPISAQILTVNENELRLKLELVSETVEKNYRAADSPYVCPDMPR